MRKLSRRILKGATKEALKISIQAVSGDLTDYAKESIKEDMEKVGISETVKRNIKKSTINIKEK